MKSKFSCSDNLFSIYFQIFLNSNDRIFELLKRIRFKLKGNVETSPFSGEAY